MNIDGYFKIENEKGFVVDNSVFVDIVLCPIVFQSIEHFLLNYY